jgi:hypothetical protein
VRDPRDIDLGGGQRGLIVPAAAVERVDDLGRARALAREMMHAPGGAARLRALAEQKAFGFVDDERTIELIAAMLVDRELMLVRCADPLNPLPPRIGPGGTHDDGGRRLSDLLPRGTTDTTPSWIELVVFGRDGLRLTGTSLQLRLPDGEQRTHRLDASGRVRLDELAREGSCEVQLVSPVAWEVPKEPAVAQRPDVVLRIESPRPLKLLTGKTHRIEVAPQPSPTTSLPAGCFALRSCFPTAAMGVFVETLAQRLQDEPNLKVGVFGHTDPTGSDATNKALSDRRARTVHTILTNDVDAFDVLAEEEPWDLAHYQAMLRGVGCNPAALDAEVGELTKLATRWFQEEWNLGIHHVDGPAQPLDVDGDLGPLTKAALRRAYLLLLSAQLAREQFHGEGWAGCASFNPIATTAPLQRRGSLVLWGRNAPAIEAFPCRAGDVSACTIDDGGLRRCKFYRLFVAEEESTTPTLMFDFEWMPLPSGKYNLSALTSLPDDTPIELQVARHVSDFSARLGVQRASFDAGGEPMGAKFTGLVRHGVCLGLFTPPEGWSPYDTVDWFGDVEHEDATSGWFRPPLFRISWPGGYAWSAPPGWRIDRFVAQKAAEPALAMCNDGTFVRFATDGGRVIAPPRRRGDEHLRVVDWTRYLEFTDEPQEDES